MFNAIRDYRVSPEQDGYEQSKDTNNAVNYVQEKVK